MSLNINKPTMLKVEKKITQIPEKEKFNEAEQENRIFQDNKHGKRNNLARFMNIREEEKKPSKKEKNQEGQNSENQNAMTHAESIAKKLRESRKRHEMFIKHKRNSLPTLAEPSKVSLDTNCNSSTSMNTLISNTLNTHASNILTTTESIQRKNSEEETKEKKRNKIMRQLTISNNTILSPKRQITPQQRPLGLISNQILKRPDSGKKQPVSRNHINTGIFELKSISDMTTPSAYNTISNSEAKLELEKEKYFETRQDKQDITGNARSPRKKENSRNTKNFHTENLDSQTSDTDLQNLGIDLPKLKGTTKSLLKKNSMQQTLNNYENGPRIMNIVNNVNPKTTDKKVEINFNQYEIKIVPEKKNSNFLKNNHNNFNSHNVHNHNDNRDQVVMTQSELDSEADSSMSSAMVSKNENNDSPTNFNAYKDKPKPTPSKFDNREKLSSKQPIVKKLTMNPRSNEIKSPTKIVINKSQKNTIVVSFNNKENMDNLKFNVNKKNEDKSVSISIKNNNNENNNINMKEEKSANKSYTDDNASSDSSLDDIKKNKKQFILRAVEMKGIPEKEENKEISVNQQNDSHLDQININETQDENNSLSPLTNNNIHDEPYLPVEEKEEDFTFNKKDHDYKYRQTALKPNYKNFMRQLSRISEISNYFSRGDDANNSFENIPMTIKKLKFCDKNIEENEELELHRGLQQKDFQEQDNLIEEEKDLNSNNSSQDDSTVQNPSPGNMSDNHNESKKDVYLQIVTEHSNSHNYKSEDSIFHRGIMTSFHKDEGSKNSSSESNTSEIRVLPKRTFNSSKNILRPVRKDSMKSLQMMNIQHSKTLPNDFQFASLDDDSEILSEEIKNMIERLEKDIDRAQDQFLERSSKHINEYCESLLKQNFDKHKVKKVYRRLQLGMCDLLIKSSDLFNEHNFVKLDEFENLENATRNVRVMVEKDYSKKLTDTFFDVNPFERIFCDTDFQKDLESSPNNKNTLIINFRKSEERKLRMLASFRRRSVAQSEHFLNRSMRSSLVANHNILQNLSIEKSDKSEKKQNIAEKYSPQTPKSQQRQSMSIVDYFKMNQAIAFIRLGANNLVYANKFLYLDQGEKDNVEVRHPLSNEVKKVKWRKDENDKIELVVNRGIVAPVKKTASISLFNTNFNSLFANLNDKAPESKKSNIQIIGNQSGDSDHQDDEYEKASKIRKSIIKLIIFYIDTSKESNGSLPRDKNVFQQRTIKLDKMEKMDKNKLKTSLRIMKVNEDTQEMLNKLFPRNFSILKKTKFFEPIKHKVLLTPKK